MENLKTTKEAGLAGNGITEQRIHQKCYLWFHNTYPKYRGLLCYNHNNARNAIEGATLRSIGLQKGRSDMVFYFRGKAYMLEFKTENGKQSPEQKQWQEVIQENGFEYVIIRNLHEFQETMTNIIFYD